MLCEHLSLTNFRNYARLELDLPPGPTLLIGPNAQGKTNLLEAVYYLATTRSFRGATDREMVNQGVEADEEFLQFTRLAGRVRRETDSITVDIVLRPSRSDAPAGEFAATSAGMKRIKVNGAPKRALDLIGQVNVVAFAPQDVDLICGSPSVRRRYLDITISQVDPRYVRTLSHYQKVLLQRNSLLKSIREGRARTDQLGYWDEELVNAGAFVIRRRAETIAALQRLSAALHRTLTGLREQLALRYAPNLPPDSAAAPPEAEGADEGADLAALRERFMRELRAALPRERQLGQSLVGPHRDDVVFEVDGVNMNAFGSRGQQRTVALSLKLAELQLMREQTGRQPILLLDDVMSELDEARRARVVDAIAEDQQVLAAGTDLEPFGNALRTHAHVLRIQHGTVRAWDRPER